METLYLLHYNNYYNRIVKKEDSLSDYQQYLVKYNGEADDTNGKSAVVQGVNFIENDFVNTQQVVNWGGDEPDYLLVVDEEQNIKSRWFVIEARKTRMGQLQLTLHRDLMVDLYEEVIDAPVFIEKATLQENNDLIFNSEDMSFNQIKTKELLLKDDSKCPWVCIYAASKDAEGNPTVFNGTFGDNFPVNKIFQSVQEWQNSEIYKVANGSMVLASGLYDVIVNYRFSKWNVSTGTTQYNDAIGQTSASVTKLAAQDYSSYHQETTKSDGEIASAFQNSWSSIINSIQIDLNGYSPSAYDDFSKYNNQFYGVIQSNGTVKYYRVQVSSETITVTNKQEQNNSLYNTYTTIMGTLGSVSGSTKRPTTSYKYLKRAVTIDDVTSSTDVYSYNITNARYHLIDSPYDMFVMPLSDTLVIKNSLKSGFVNVTSSKDLATKVARSLIEKYAGAGQVYDAQILPYCPLPSTVVSESNGVVTLDLSDNSDLMYTPIRLSETTVGYILNATVSSFTRSIVLDEPIVINNYKIESQCDMYRLCSPNYNGVFEFNAAKNGGVSYINIACTYKPYSPYIKVYPDFKRLYGSNYNDARGLICGGDFSLPMTTSAWSTYELQNKNYQLSFDRQIQNMEVNNSVQRTKEIVGAVTGTVQGAATGAMAGSMFGPVGAAVGGAVGGIASAAGGIADVILNDQLRNEALDYTKDQFGYQLGNIKALPQSLSKVAAYNVDNKYFPFLEFYTCSQVEKKALANKVAYNGMTVMTIGTISEYIENSWQYTLQSGEVIQAKGYIKGKLIRLEGNSFDYHIVTALADELNKGVFI